MCTFESRKNQFVLAVLQSFSDPTPSEPSIDLELWRDVALQKVMTSI